MPKLTRRALLAAAGLPARAGIVEGKAIRAGHGVVAVNPREAAQAGARVLAEGGNAMDAAAAAALAVCIVTPQMVDVGGYVAAGVVLDGKTGRIWSLDANSVAPAAARAGMYKVLPLRAGARGTNENEYHCSVENDANVHGLLAVGVPGTMAGIGLLWEKWGRLRWPRITKPAQDLLANGFPFGTVAGAVAARAKIIAAMEPAKAHFFVNGSPPKPENIWYRPGMEKTMRRLESAGWEDLYRGELARHIAGYVQSGGGILTQGDLANFRPRLTEPYSSSFHGLRYHHAILANGGLSVIEALNLLETIELPPRDDPRHWHLLAEVLKMVWRDRLQYLGDPSSAKVPVERLLSKDYAAGRAETLRRFPMSVDRQPGPEAAHSPGTTHISTADREGNLVSMTISHGGSFGSCVTVPGFGITLGHGMCRFDPRPGLPNSVDAGKRPLNNTAPAILEINGRWIAAGLAGGRRIINVATGLALALAAGASPEQAVAAPRIHTEGFEPIEATRPGVLGTLGHTVKQAAVGGTANIAEINKDGLLAAGSVSCAGV
ncbi:MAG: hypothetical protein FJW30_03960 [Acidobacteria bacterium]|nr:hypothetical protein [Acidobacteriota bacterium]